MAVNVPLVTISGLTEQATAADTDCMVIGGTDAKKIKWSTIISLIRTKLGIGSTSLNGIGDGTVTGAIRALNTRMTYAKGNVTNGIAVSSLIEQAQTGISFYNSDANHHVNPLPSVNEYGTFILFKGSFYPQLIYISVLGEVCVWRQYDSKWVS